MTLKTNLLLGLCCTVVLTTGCASGGTYSLTNDQRSSLRKVLFIPSDEGVTASTTRLSVESLSGERGSLVGWRREMSRAQYDAQTAELVATLEECLSTTYGANVPSVERMSSLMSELIANENPFGITFVPDVKLEEFIGLELEERRAFLAEYSADGVLTMRVYHRAGFQVFRGLIPRLHPGVLTILFALVFDRDGILAHRTDETTLGPVRVDDPGFCAQYTDQLDRALEELPPRWYAEIVGNN